VCFCLKNTGIVRKIDELGRIVLPKELRNTLKISSGDDLEIFIENDAVILKKISTMENLQVESNRIISSVENLVDSSLYVTDKDKVLTKSDLENEHLPEKFQQLLIERKSYESLSKETFVFNTKTKEGYYYIEPIIQDSNANGLIILIKNDNITNQDKFFAKILKNIIENK